MSNEQPGRAGPGSRTRIAIVAVPIVAITIAMWVGNALAPTLASDAPHLLLALSPRLELMALVSPKVDTVSFYLIPLVRAAGVLGVWYLLGLWYNDRALRWVESQTGKAAKPLLWVERNFNKARYPVTFLFPINISAMLAGASGMSAPGFFAVALASNALRYWAVRALSEEFRGTMLDALDFVNQYQLYLTVGTVVLVIGWVTWSNREGFREPDSVEELIEEFEPEPTPEP